MPHRKREDTDSAGERETTEDDSGPSLRGEFTLHAAENLTFAGNALLHHGGAGDPAQRRWCGRPTRCPAAG